ncbi:MAG: 6-bladed beta-propeller [Rhodothermus sp.]|nr:6-bladed beta-propeller [Rhodothermus sp.]
MADNGDWSVKKYSLEGKLLARYGGRRGEGPGELLGIGDIAVYREHLWVVDIQARKLLHFDEKTGRYLGEFKTPDLYPLRIAQVGPYLFVLGLGPFEELIVQYDTAGQLRRRFGHLTDR